MQPVKFGWSAVNDLVGILQTLWSKLEQVGKAIQNSPIGSLGGMVSNGTGAIGQLGGLIPHFAAGGIVSRPTIAMIGEGGERESIVPESQWGGGGDGNHFHVHFESLVTPTPQQMRDVAYALEPEFGRMLALPGTAALNGGF